MRKVISFMHVSLDSFTTGPNGELEWAIVNEELYSYIDGLFRTVDTALYGRVTYHGMESYWPTVLTDPNASPHDLKHARWVENVSKIVFSRTLEKVEWKNTRLVKDHIAEEISKLKREPGGDMMIFGSPSLTHTFMHLGLIDEYRLFLNPIVLGGGIPLFKSIKYSMPLKLVEAKVFHSGVVDLHYQAIK
ncbi:MAG: dihydrofolate reductase family protein [Chloroflexi bacterium]|nr:dihydrofolate reductase family protein [Chloroflexota bacterium]